MKIKMFENFIFNDFSLVEDTNKYHMGQLIFHKFTVKNAPFINIFLHESIMSQDYITRLFDYLSWLGTKSGDALIKYYNENIARSKISQVDLNWYINLECVYIKITINEDSKINSTIHCITRSGDDLDIALTEKEIIHMGYRIVYG